MSGHVQRHISVIPSRCLTCGTCELVCDMQWRSAHPEQAADTCSYARIRIRAVPGSPGTTLPLLCRHCHYAPCIDACPSGAMQKDGERIFVDTDRCIGCWSCVMVCPMGMVRPVGMVRLVGKACPTGNAALQRHISGPMALQAGEEATPVVRDHGYAHKCDGCPGEPVAPCVAACPTGALMASESAEEDATVHDRRRAYAACLLASLGSRSLHCL